jgi:hypothetical protein
MRRISIAGVRYLWSVEHAHDAAGACSEVFTAYLEGKKAAPVRVRFASRGGWHAGYPAERARSAGWSPETAREPCLLDGLETVLEDEPNSR